MSILSCIIQPVFRSYSKVERQISEAIAGIHNLQLHLHPQWLSAVYDEPDWELDFSKWRIGDLSDLDLDASISRGLDYLRCFDRGENPSGNLIAFRAGGWAIQPSERVLRNLRQHGIEIDTTVAPGMYNPAIGDWFDFRKSPDQAFWPIESDVCSIQPQGEMIEVPIATQYIGYAKRFRALREYRKGSPFPEGCNGSYEGPNSKWQTYKEKFSKLCRMGHLMFDFCTTPAWLLIEATQKYMDRFQDSDAAVPIVAIGHNKNYSVASDRNLDAWLRWASNQNDIVFSDFQTWHSCIRTENTSQKAG